MQVWYRPDVLVSSNVQQPTEDQVNWTISDSQRNARDDVQERIAEPSLAIDRETAREQKHHRSQSRPKQPVGYFPHKHLPKRRRLAKNRNIVRREVVIVQRVGKTYQHPNSKY